MGYRGELDAAELGFAAAAIANFFSTIKQINTILSRAPVPLAVVANRISTVFAHLELAFAEVASAPTIPG